MNDRDVAEALLLELAAGCKTSMDVAARLKMLGCKGTRRCSTGCPVWTYLECHGVLSDVGFYGVAIGGKRLGIPLAIMLFIDGFDSGHYPQLEVA